MANTASNQKIEEQEVVFEEGNPLQNIQSSYEQNKKRINTGVTVVLLLVVGFISYKNFIVGPKENKAAAAISAAQGYFQIDSMNLALNGDGQHAGFLSVIKKYSGTKAANLAHYYAGLCYLQMKDAKNALKYLSEFDAHGTNLQFSAQGAMGDAYMEMGNTKEGIEAYMKAAGDKTDNALTPLYLYRAAIAYVMNNQVDKAKENFKKIKETYPQSAQARETDKELARLGELE